MWDRKNLISINDLSRKDIQDILSLAGKFSKLGRKRFKVADGCLLANLFFEPSTRTQKSFQAAMYRLGGSTMTHKDIGSSREKGETKEDTIRVFEQYCDIMVIRDPAVGTMKKYAELLSIPLINAGDGSNEHPTQALLDLCTIQNEVGKLNGLKVAFVGDLKYGRTVHSLIQAMRKFDGNKFFGISPASLSMPEEFKGKDFEQAELKDLNQSLKEIKPDVIYATRIQKERLKEGEYATYEINQSTLDVLPKNTKIMHPLPRVGELNTEIDKDPRFIPFRQVKYGVQTRMAIIATLLGRKANK